MLPMNLRLAMASIAASASMAVQAAAEAAPPSRYRIPINGSAYIGTRTGRGPSIAQSRRAAEKKRNQIRNRRAHRG